MNKFSLFAIIIFITIIKIKINGQEGIDYNNHIKIEVYRQFKGDSKRGPIQSYYYDFDGAIKRIEGKVLNPSSDSKDKIYAANYIYMNNGKLDREELYEIYKNQIRLERLTKYEYNDNCVEVKIIENSTGEKISEIENCKDPNNNKMVKKIKYDKTYEYLKPIEYTWKYDNQNNPILLTIKDSDSNSSVNYKFRKEGKISIIITNKFQGDQLTEESIETLVFDDADNLKSIKFGDLNEYSGVEIKYDKNGFIQELLHKGRFVDTNEKTWSKLILKTEIPSLISEKTLINQKLTTKINKEIIKMYFPSMRGMHNTYYDDSRRNIQNQG